MDGALTRHTRDADYHPLALIVVNLVFVLFVGWLAHEFNQRTTHQYEVKDQLIAKLLDQCKTGQQ